MVIRSYFGRFRNFSMKWLTFRKIENKAPLFGVWDKKHRYMEITAIRPETDMTVKQQLNDILMLVSWREVARQYFDRSSSWLYHKMDGIDGNGGKGDFTFSERVQLKGTLCDMADRLRRAAEQI